jgi:hypothetical protein
MKQICFEKDEIISLFQSFKIDRKSTITKQRKELKNPNSALHPEIFGINYAKDLIFSKTNSLLINMKEINMNEDCLRNIIPMIIGLLF